MQRLIAEVFEMGRMKAGLGLGLSIAPGDIAAFVRSLVEDARLAHPSTPVVTEIPVTLHAGFDPDRMAQVVNNLLSNARNHGAIGGPVSVSLADEAAQIVLRVANLSPPIVEGAIHSLFDPFKPNSIGNVRNPGGLGLGLYIASEVAKGHGGTLAYSYDGTRVTFTVTFPP